MSSNAKRFRMSGAIAVAALAASATHASAATFSVTSGADAGAGTLRQAITDANANGAAETDQINLNLTGTIDLTAELPAVSTPTTITGPGAASLAIRRSSGTGRILPVTLANAAHQLRIERVTFSGARAPGFAGGVIFKGGAGTLSIDEAVFTDNDAASGGAIYADGGTIAITDSTFSGNRVTGFGGAIFMGSNAGAGTNALGSALNSTFSGNTAGEFGGAISITQQAHMGLGNATVVGNVANSDNNVTGNGGGLWHNSNDPMSFEFGVLNTIIAGNSVGPGAPGVIGTQCAGNAYASFGYNLRSVDEAACGGFGTTGDIVADPTLGALSTSYGSPTPIVPLISSPAIDAGSPGPATGFPGCEPTDQRGQPRPAGGRCDIGAFERQLGDSGYEQGPRAVDPPPGAKPKVKKCKGKKRKKKATGRAAKGKKKAKKCRRKRPKK